MKKPAIALFEVIEDMGRIGSTTLPVAYDAETSVPEAGDERPTMPCLVASSRELVWGTRGADAERLAKEFGVS